MVNITGLMSTLITANHILSYHNVLDSFGHISVRNPNTNDTFFIALQLGATYMFLTSSLTYLSNNRPGSSTGTVRHWRVLHLRRLARQRHNRWLRRTVHPLGNFESLP